MTVPAHDQAETHHYTIRYPEHFPRETAGLSELSILSFQLSAKDK